MSPCSTTRRNVAAQTRGSASPSRNQGGRRSLRANARASPSRAGISMRSGPRSSFRKNARSRRRRRMRAQGSRYSTSHRHRTRAAASRQGRAHRKNASAGARPCTAALTTKRCGNSSTSRIAATELRCIPTTASTRRE